MHLHEGDFAQSSQSFFLLFFFGPEGSGGMPPEQNRSIGKNTCTCTTIYLKRPPIARYHNIIIIIIISWSYLSIIRVTSIPFRSIILTHTRILGSYPIYIMSVCMMSSQPRSLNGIHEWIADCRRKFNFNKGEFPTMHAQY
jgi:hypothetical protein